MAFSGCGKKLTHIALTIFFISYALAEPVTNVLLKKYTPRLFFTAIILLWGLCMTLMGLVTNKAGLYACRVSYYHTTTISVPVVIVLFQNRKLTILSSSWVLLRQVYFQ